MISYLQRYEKIIKQNKQTLKNIFYLCKNKFTMSAHDKAKKYAKLNSEKFAANPTFKIEYLIEQAYKAGYKARNREALKGWVKSK
jgi:hypothetical protein